MSNFYKYLPASSGDAEWGLQVLHAGCQECEAGENYPEPTHPDHHNFKWETGRVLQEFSLVYIISGKGLYNSRQTGDVPINGGSVILVFPNERHRYRPDPETGWKEYWIGFDGSIMANLMENDFFTPTFPIFQIGYHETTMSIFMQTIDAIKSEKPGYQPLVCGAVMYILGQLKYAYKQRSALEGKNEMLIDSARMIIRNNLHTTLSPLDVALRLDIGYSRFRKLFKTLTGLAPGQYHTQLKLEKAKEELVNTTKSIKEIAFELNFETQQYFAHLFKEHTGFTPNAFRKNFNK